MTKPKKFQYQIQYTDNTYRIVEWTKAEFSLVGDAIIDEKSAIVLDDGIFRLNEVRTIVFIPGPPEPEKTEDEENQLGEWDFVDDPDVKDYLRDIGLVGKGVNN